MVFKHKYTYIYLASSILINLFDYGIFGKTI